ncbi:hypothetical protein Taro_015777 [Colocasia esculenta]|uniref:Uncharacterized protein n=1 Tax=Colocasia esculenta TaxID=4460 RepID=A0A843UC83_COLES|nr:hypothetical protein [Colocasia esculenta]
MKVVPYDFLYELQLESYQMKISFRPLKCIKRLSRYIDEPSVHFNETTFGSENKVKYEVIIITRKMY